MKVILLKDVPKVGKKYEIKEIADGYARNLLFPKKLAEPASQGRIAALMASKEKSLKEQELRETRAAETLASLEGKSFVIEAKADERGHLFKKIRAEDVSRAITESGFAVEAHMLDMEKPLATTGDHTVRLVSGENTANVTVTVQK